MWINSPSSKVVKSTISLISPSKLFTAWTDTEYSVYGVSMLNENITTSPDVLHISSPDGLEIEMI